MILSIVFACALMLCADASIVITSSGPVRGVLLNDTGVSYYAYQAIPYAENPTGDLRFKPPVPKKPWIQVLDASKPGPGCPQPEGKVTRASMSENCLHVNIFVPANRTRQLLPVLVYVHGGWFRANSGNIDVLYGPQLLLKRGIIYVSMNYRLGALGYLSLETEEASGNAGLKDLLLALKWIKKNIKKFGGGEITIGGQSSGAAMVHIMLLTNQSKGLFDRAILNSGSATNSRFLVRHPKDYAVALANELGLVNSENSVLQQLKNADVFDIIDAQENIYKNISMTMGPFAPFVPCIEKEFEHAILTRDPIKIIKEGIPQNIPILAGINSLEGAFMWPLLHSKSQETLQKHFPFSIPADIEYPIGSDMYIDLVNSISELYFGDTNLTNWSLTNFYDLLTDTQYIYSVDSWIKMYKETEKSAELYYYLFNFDGDLNWAKRNYKIKFPGPVHADEIGYWFVTKATEDKLDHVDERTQLTMDNILTLFSNFIKYGKPIECGSASFEWPQYSGKGTHLVINDRPAPVYHAPFAERLAFWANVYRQYNEYVENGGLLQSQIPPQ